MCIYYVSLIQGLRIGRAWFLYLLQILDYQIVQRTIAITDLAHNKPQTHIFFFVQLLDRSSVIANVWVLGNFTNNLSSRDKSTSIFDRKMQQPRFQRIVSQQAYLPGSTHQNYSRLRFLESGRKSTFSTS